ncbi:MAG TPA: vWA domain-containing protein [Thermoguttaceae bacterium]|nr:vWA domain-containing protein [Thermoguttaceae bacterium]
MFASFPLLADGTARTVWGWGRIESNADLVVPLLVVAALGVLARWMIRLDGRELSPLVGWLLTALRIGAILGLLVIYLQPEWRSERELVRNSRVLLLVDTSSSMGLTDVESSRRASGASRLEHVAQTLGETDFLDRLRNTQDVVVLRFDENLGRIVSLSKLVPGAPASDDAADGPHASVPSQASDPPASENDRSGAGVPSSETPGESETAAARDAAGQSAADEQIDWREALAPTGAQTRLGQALRELVHDERGSPVAGIVVFSDGGQNAGISPEAAIEAARTAKVPIFTVGLGSLKRAVNVRVVKLEVPPLAYPGDPYVATGLIQAQGLAGESATVELLMREADEEGQAAEPGSGIPVRREEVILGADGEALPVKFELTPTETGRRTICLRVDAPEADSDPSDDYQEEEVEIVDRKIRVLLFGGGPTREYRFLRTQLYRDASTTLDVLLQTGQAGISQEADRILDEFPADREEMYVYDCVVALDPDWRVLTEGQVDLLEGWLAEQGGGLIVVAGPIHAGESISGWVQDPSLSKIRALYPVEFRRQLTAFEGGAYASRDPWPLDFTREGLEAEFLWLGDTATASEQVWAEFPGVYGSFPVRGPKPGAAVLARFSDPRAGQSDAERVYFAEQFYGSGRVFYAGSGEMWRLRRVDEGHFVRWYTRLIRHVSAGRVLRQSSRGTLMVDQDRYVLGSTVQIRARLTNPQLDPLEATRVPLNVIRPDGNVRTITLRPDPSRAGMFAGQLTVLGEGTYRLELPVPESDDERLTRRIKVTLPDLERQSPQRNDKLLSRIAQGTGGKYYPELEAAVSANSRDPLVANLKDRTRSIIQTGVLEPPSLRWTLGQWLPERPWARAWLSWLADESWLRTLLDQTLIWWLMIILCSLLCCEWLIRRLSKLA